MDGETGLHVALARGHRGVRRGWLAAAALAACSDSASVVAPVIDGPVDDADATASPLDEISFTVAHAGSDRELVQQSFFSGASIEIPDVPFGDDLVLHMTGFVGVSTVAYGRTCAIAVSPGAPPAAPHLFFARTVKFASLDIAPTPRIGGLGIPYLGAGLLVGGTDENGDPISSVERFDPLTGELTPLGSVLPRVGAVQALVGTSPPRVVVVGGVDSAGGAKFVELLDGRGVERLDFAEMARVDLTATSLTDGRVIAIGGREPGGLPSGDIDEVSVDAVSLVVRKLAEPLAHPRSGHTATRLGDDVGAPVLIAGGVDDREQPIAAAELFKPLSEGLAKMFAPAMLIPRHHHVAKLMPDGSTLIIGGLDATGQPVRKLELFSLDSGFSQAGDLPVAAGVVEIGATTLPDGRILITGGRATPDSEPLDTAYIARLDPLDGRVDVVATDHLAVARAGHQAVTLCDGTVLITGGTAGPSSAERYNPPPSGRR
jgi:hypothetical protein